MVRYATAASSAASSLHARRTRSHSGTTPAQIATKVTRTSSSGPSKARWRSASGTITYVGWMPKWLSPAVGAYMKWPWFVSYSIRSKIGKSLPLASKAPNLKSWLASSETKEHAASTAIAQVDTRGPSRFPTARHCQSSAGNTMRLRAVW